MPEQWPYPGDTAVVQARRVALAYRQKLMQFAPFAVEGIDRRMRALGQHWVIAQPVVADPDAWLPAGKAANLAAISTDALRALRRAGRISGQRRGNQYWYRVGDIMGLAERPRTRQRKDTP
jgi:hypothetical protein